MPAASFARLGLRAGCFSPLVICNARFEQSTIVIGPSRLVQQSAAVRNACLPASINDSPHPIFRRLRFAGLDIIGFVSKSTIQEPDSDRSGFPIFWGAALKGVDTKAIELHGASILGLLSELLRPYFPGDSDATPSDAVQRFLTEKSAQEIQERFDRLASVLDDYSDVLTVSSRGSRTWLEKLFSLARRWRKPSGFGKSRVRMADTENRAIYDFFLKIWAAHGHPLECSIAYVPELTGENPCVIIEVERNSLGMIHVVEKLPRRMTRPTEAKPELPSEQEGIRQDRVNR